MGRAHMNSSLARKLVWIYKCVQARFGSNFSGPNDRASSLPNPIDSLTYNCAVVFEDREIIKFFEKIKN